MTGSQTLTIDGRLVQIAGQQNLLELIRASGIDLPTFCYHSDLSVYGACRLCLVEVAGKGLVTSCTTQPEPGMVVKTNTAEIRGIRRITVELLLANHEVNCPTCPKSGTCQLLKLADRLGANPVRYRRRTKHRPVDISSPALVRNPNKCVLCGDCVRFCQEIQGIGVLDFAFRGSAVQVQPAFGMKLEHTECVNCGQCASLCPTGALAVQSHLDQVWQAIHDPKRVVVAQVAPAVRIGMSEAFGLPAGETSMGQIVAALKYMGVEKVYDTAFAADLTVLEEGTEFLARFQEGRHLPQFTSCCPAWVKLVEQYYPEILDNLSTCKSPQQMLGRVLKRELPLELGVKPEQVFVVSIMPCTAKKFEAKRPEFTSNGLPDVDAVITTHELRKMIMEAGLDFPSLEPERLDLPFGFKSGAGVLFGTTGGVAEAVLRFASQALGGSRQGPVNFRPLRGLKPVKEAEVTLGGSTVKVAAVHGLGAAQRLLEDILQGRVQYDLVEVMACPGGCVGGAGQPIPKDVSVRQARQAGIYQLDTMLQMHNSQDNPYLQRFYTDVLGSPNQGLSHDLLHTSYHPRRRIEAKEMVLQAGAEALVHLAVCVGTNCHLKGGHDLLRQVLAHVEERGQAHLVDISASFCSEACEKGPCVRMNGRLLEKCTLAELARCLDQEIAQAQNR
ncbi:MAG: [FeFe] hydrogenase, group A [Bacillota bacterium]